MKKIYRPGFFRLPIILMSVLAAIICAAGCFVSGYELAMHRATTAEGTVIGDSFYLFVDNNIYEWSLSNE